MNWKRMLSLLLTLAMVVSLLSVGAAPAAAADRNTITVTSETKDWTNGNTYVVTGEVTISSRISVSGSVTLYLSEGSHLKANQGILVDSNKSLTINGSGTLTATGSSKCAGIGGNYNCGYITINGGTINATGGSRGAGIGGGVHGGPQTITINGGVVNATGGYHAAGIGGGSNENWAGGYGGNGTVIINGGVVVATGNGYGAGIGGGGTEYTNSTVFAGSGGSITINGGKVTASSPNGYGIGPGVSAIGNNGSDGAISLGLSCAGEYIQSNSYRGTVTFHGDSPLYRESDGALATASNIDGQKLVAAGNVPMPPATNPPAIFTVTWQDWDGTELSVDTVIEGDVPEYGGATPQRDSDYDYTYEFIGWDPTPAAATGNAVYTAVYRSAAIDHSITFMVPWEDGYDTVSSYTYLTDDTLEWTDDVYVAQGEVCIEDRITVSGEVTLILMDGAVLTAEQGINVGEGAALSIFAESDGDNQGVLNAYGFTAELDNGYAYYSAVGGWVNCADDEGESTGEIFIAGGAINAESDEASAIGGGSPEMGFWYYGGSIHISGGTVYAYSECGTAIGSMNGGTDILIDGGTVTAVSGSATAIGITLTDEDVEFDSSITIRDDCVVDAASGGAAIGLTAPEAWGSAELEIVIRGGQVSAVCAAEEDSGCAAIGGGCVGSFIELRIGGAAKVYADVENEGNWGIGGDGVQYMELGLGYDNEDCYITAVSWYMPGPEDEEEPDVTFPTVFYYPDSRTGEQVMWPIAPESAIATYYGDFFTVVFDFDDGESEPDELIVADGYAVPEPPEPERTGYLFEGWYYVTDGEEMVEYDFSEPVENDLHLYANWTENGINVVFDPGDQEGDPVTEYAEENEIELPGCPFEVPDGYVFVGWLPEGSDVVLEPGTVYTLSGDTVFYAQWKEVYYLVYDPGDGSIDGDEPEPIFLAEGEELTAERPEDLAFIGTEELSYFDCWLLDTEDGPLYLMPGELVPTDLGSITLVAQWRGMNAWETLQAEIDEIEASEDKVGTVTLTEDTVAAYGDNYIHIPAGVTVTLDLNGYTLDRNLFHAPEEETLLTPEFWEKLYYYEYDYDGDIWSPVVMVYGTLIVNDSSEEETGVICGGFESGIEVYGTYYRAALVDDEDGGDGDDGEDEPPVSTSILIFNGGTLRDNNYGGLYVHNGASITMNGGTVVNNICDEGGAGVYVGSHSEFIMNGGEIISNVDLEGGAGVYVNSRARFEMNDGLIAGNRVLELRKLQGDFADGDDILAQSDNPENDIYSNIGCGGGVYVNHRGAFTMNGGAICGNEARNGAGVYVCGMELEKDGGEMESQPIEIYPISDEPEEDEETFGFIMNGGEISCNMAELLGGGVYSQRPVLITDGSIIENCAVYGGGVYLAYISMDGEAEYEKLTKDGDGDDGAADEEEPDDSDAADALSDFDNAICAGLTVKGGEISANFAEIYGGGIYAGTIEPYGYWNGFVEEEAFCLTKFRQSLSIPLPYVPYGDYVVLPYMLMIDGGEINANIAGEYGGGVFTALPSLMTDGCVDDNWALMGGGIYALVDPSISFDYDDEEEGEYYESAATRDAEDGEIEGDEENDAPDFSGLFGVGLTLKGGEISGNIAMICGGGVYVTYDYDSMTKEAREEESPAQSFDYDSGLIVNFPLVITDGEIAENKVGPGLDASAEEWQEYMTEYGVDQPPMAGGVFVEGAVLFAGGSITGNQAEYGAGLVSSDEALLLGGSITENLAYNDVGGVLCYEAIYLGNDIRIVDNRKVDYSQFEFLRGEADGDEEPAAEDELAFASSNVVLGGNLRIMMPLTEDALVGVSVSDYGGLEAPRYDQPVIFTDGLTDKGFGENFFSDDPAYSVIELDVYEYEYERFVKDGDDGEGGGDEDPIDDGAGGDPGDPGDGGDGGGDDPGDDPGPTGDEGSGQISVGYEAALCCNYKVTFVLDEADPTLNETVYVMERDFLDEPDDPERTGFDFKGWYVKNSTTQEYDLYNFCASVVNDLTLVARWCAVVTLDPGVIGGESETIEVYGVETITVPGCPFGEHDGYEFLGWTVEGEEDLLEASDEYTVTGHVTFVAAWQALNTLTYDPGEGSVENAPDPIYFTAGEDISAMSVSELGFVGPEETPCFDGWQLQTEDGAVIFYVGDDLPTKQGNLTLVAQWREANAWDRVQEAIDAIAASEAKTGTVTLTEDTVAVLSNSALFIPVGVSVTLDLAGYTLDRGLFPCPTPEQIMSEEFWSDYYDNCCNWSSAIVVEGSLTVCDSSEDGDGMICGANETAIYLHMHENLTKAEDGEEDETPRPTLTMNGGAIAYNLYGAVYGEVCDITINDGLIFMNFSDEGGAGVYVGYRTNFVMNDGVIAANLVFYVGGGVCVDNGGSFVMNGGVIAENCVYIFPSMIEDAGDGLYEGIICYGALGGGGVYVTPRGSFIMNDGTITENYAVNGGGVFVAPSGMALKRDGELLSDGPGDGEDEELSYEELFFPFIMNGGEISGNTAALFGGGVYSMAPSVMHDGIISANDALYGGGVYYCQYGNLFNSIGFSDLKALLESEEGDEEGDEIGGDTDNLFGVGFNVKGGEIVENTAYLSGGGIYAGSYEPYSPVYNEVQLVDISRDRSVISASSLVMTFGDLRLVPYMLYIAGGEISGNVAGVEDDLFVPDYLEDIVFPPDLPELFGLGGGVYTVLPTLMTGGAIDGNEALYGGGVYVVPYTDDYFLGRSRGEQSDSGAAKTDTIDASAFFSMGFTMKDGGIVGNTALLGGGGIYTAESIYPYYDAYDYLEKGQIAHPLTRSADESDGEIDLEHALMMPFVLVITGGEISENTVGLPEDATDEEWNEFIEEYGLAEPPAGGGVYSELPLLFAGGSIADNYAEYAGGLCCEYGAYLLGGSITGNRVGYDVGGVICYGGIYLGGDIRIEDNGRAEYIIDEQATLEPIQGPVDGLEPKTRNGAADEAEAPAAPEKNYVPSNLALISDYLRFIMPLTEDASIGVHVCHTGGSFGLPSSGDPLVFTSGLGGMGSWQCFFSDEPRYTVVPYALVLRETLENECSYEAALAYNYTVTLQLDTDETETVYVLENTAMTPPEDPEKAGCTFDGWYIMDTVTNQYVLYDFTLAVTGNLTLVAFWTALPAPVIVSEPADVEAVEGDTVTFAVEAEGEGELSYQWYYLAPGAEEFTKVKRNGTGAEYSLKVELRHNGYQYMCVVTDANGFTTDSTVAALTVTAPAKELEITTQPEDVTAPEGGTAVFTVVAEGEGELSYQWYVKKTADGDWSVIKSNSTSATYSLTVLARHNGYQYYCLVTDETGAEAQSDIVTLTVAEPAAELTVTTQPVDVTAPEGGTAVFTVEAEGEGELSYQWYVKKSASGDWTPVKATSAKTATYTLTALAKHNGYQYYCLVTDDSGAEAQSDVVTLTVTAAVEEELTVTTQPVDVTAPEGGTAVFTVEAEGEGELSYQWYVKKSASGDWTPVKATSAKTATYTLTALAKHNGYQYYCLVTDDSEAEVQSEIVTLTVTAAAAAELTITAQPVSVTVSEGSAAVFTVAAQGEGELSYQWYVKKSASGDWSAVKSNSTSATYRLTALAKHNGYQYYCLVTDDSGAETQSDVVTLTVTAAVAAELTITAQPVSVTVPEGGAAVFTVAAQGEGELSYQWYVKKTADGDWSIIKSNSTSATYTLAVLARHNGYQYYCLVMDASGAQAQSDIVTLTVGDPVQAGPAISAQSGDVTVTVGEAAVFSVVAQGEGLSYQWYVKKGDNADWSAIKSGSTRATYTLTTQLKHNGYQYYCLVTDENGETVASEAVTLTVNPAN